MPPSPQELAVLFFAQLGVILVAIRLVGSLAQRMGQPQVIGEMITGVILGPSLFGAYLPEWQAALFPKFSIPSLFVVSQIGLTLYMFVIGAEFDLNLLRGRARHALAVSLAGILAPFGLGAILALSLVHQAGFFAPTISPLEAVLFVGSAMSITAFPMLARIIHERRLANTSLGTLALAAGATDDAAAWCFLAVVVASFSGDHTAAVLAIGGGVVYALVTMILIRPLLASLASRYHLTPETFLGLILPLLCFASWLTDTIGIYCVFGAFILGLAVPRGTISKHVIQRIEPLTTKLLLPLFFIYSGLRTDLRVMLDPHYLLVAVLVVLAACIGKGVACSAAAYLSGERPRSALAIGTLMNARGLMELILLNIGLERNLISTNFFSIMVIMAIVTTLMATPIFNFIMRNNDELSSQDKQDEEITLLAHSEAR